MSNSQSTSSTSQPLIQSTVPLIIDRENHGLSRKMMSNNALNIVYELNKAGHESYLVGGCLRDLLLGEKPKDFDVATSATPEQIKKIFRKARIVGRRFKIVHVRFGQDIIEVTTFRSNNTCASDPAITHTQQNEEGMLLRDNVYGTVEEDAIRRDFTVNAFYYSVKDFCIYDYCNGINDLENKLLRIIGDPETRYREDPVRMLRAIRFAAKLDFSLEENTANAIYQLHHLISQVSPARLFDESVKILLNGYGEKAVTHLMKFGLLQYFIPTVHTDSETLPPIIINALKNTDERVAEKKHVTPAFIYACFLWEKLKDNLYTNTNNMLPLYRTLQITGHQTLQTLHSSLSIPKRFGLVMNEIWCLQYNLENCKKARSLNILSHPRFRAAYDFLLLRHESNDKPLTKIENLESCINYWNELQKKNPEKLYNSSKRKNNTQKNRQRYNNKNNTW